MKLSVSNSVVQLIFGLIIIQMFSVVYAMSITVGYKPIQVITLVSLIFVTLLLFFIQTSDKSRLMLLIGITTTCMWLSLPIASESNVLKELFENITLDLDRIQIRSMPIILCTLLFFFRVLYILVEHQPRIAVWSFGVIILFIAILLSHDYETFSIFQVIIDFFYLLGAYSVYLYMRFVMPNEQYKDLYLFSTRVMLLLSTFIVFDLLFTAMGIGSWAWSYRDGLQGFFYGNEVIYSFVLGIAVTFLFSYFRNPLLKAFFSIIGLILIYMTQAETGVYAVIISLIVLNNNFTRFINGKIILIGIALIALYFIVYVDLFEAETSSLFVRVGTYYIAFSQLLDGGWIFGIKPGVMDITTETNLAIMIWEVGFRDIINVLPPVLSEELVGRSSYETGTPILPHNSALALFSSYGLILLFPVIYYYYFLPYLIVSKLGKKIPEDVIVVGRLFVFIAVFSYVHPIITPIMLVFFGEYLRFRVSGRNIDYEY